MPSLSIANNKIIDFVKKHNFLLVCFLCFVTCLSAIVIGKYAFIIFCIEIIALSFFYDANKMTLLCSFSIFYALLLNFWSEILVFCISFSIIIVRQIISKKLQFKKSLLIPIVCCFILIVLFFLINFQFENIRYISRTILASILLIECFVLRKDFDVLYLVKNLAFLFLVSCAISFFFVIFNSDISIFYVDSLGIKRYRGLLGHENIVAMFSIILISLLLQLFITKKMSNLQFLIYCLPLILFGLLTKGKLFLLLFLLLSIVYLVFVFNNNKKQGAVQLTCLVLAGLLFLAVNTSFFTQMINRFTGYFTEGSFLDKITTGRFSLWHNYLNLWSSSFLTILFGIGGSTTLSLIAAHNEFIEILTRYGLVGFACVIVIVAYICYALRNKTKFDFKNYLAFAVCVITMMVDPFIQEKFILFCISILAIASNENKENSLNNLVSEKKETSNIDETVLVSVIIPIYKVEKYLTKCLDSVINQTYKNLEIILVDDGSPDNCPKICDDYALKDNRIRVIHKENGGVSLARNIGLDNAKGDLISFVDSDDYLNDTYYEEAVGAILKEDCDIVISRFNIDNGKIKQCNETDLYNFIKTKNYDYLFNRARLLEDTSFWVIDKNVPCFLWRMIFKSNYIGKTRFHEDVKVMEDLLFFMECCAKKPKASFSYIDKCLYNYVVRKESAIHIKGSILNSHKNFIKYLEIIKLPNIEEYVKMFQFTVYADCVLRKEVFGVKDDLKEISNWGNKNNYDLSKKYTFGKSLKLKNYLIFKKHYRILKLLYKLAGKN